jgi:hypothetical protein
MSPRLTDGPEPPVRSSQDHDPVRTCRGGAPARERATRWLGQRCQPRWLSLTAWTSAASSAIALAALATTGDK